VVSAAFRLHRERDHRREVDGVLDFILIIGTLVGLPVLTEAGRLLVSLLVRLIGLAFMMAFVMIILLLLVTHGKVI
jgi:hypothetical protein